MGAPRTLNDGIELNLSESQASLFSDFLKAQHRHEKVPFSWSSSLHSLS